jgi:uncharacterized LabA/DUF88 family protein
MRAVIFIDYQNVYMGARRAFAPDQSVASPFGQFNPSLLAQKIMDRNHKISKIAEIRIYRGLPLASYDKKGHVSAMTQINYWTKDPRISVITRPLSYRRISGPDVPRKIMMEKGIDVSLAIDFVTQAIKGEYDLGIIFSSDTDLKPALEFVNSDNVEAKAQVAAWRPDQGNYPRLSTGNNQPYCHWLYSNDYFDVADHTKY